MMTEPNALPATGSAGERSLARAGGRAVVELMRGLAITFAGSEIGSDAAEVPLASSNAKNRKAVAKRKMPIIKWSDLGERICLLFI
jgi:hypothetical protein